MASWSQGRISFTDCTAPQPSSRSCRLPKDLDAAISEPTDSDIDLGVVDLLQFDGKVNQQLLCREPERNDLPKPAAASR
jgi:hypothetical protein